jgi:hypothetical protein
MGESGARRGFGEAEFGGREGDGGMAAVGGLALTNDLIPATLTRSEIMRGVEGGK